MELIQESNKNINDNENIEINGSDNFINQENELHVSVIKPITKKIIHCTNTKINAFYKPVELVEEVNSYVKKGDEYLVNLYEDLKKLENEKEAELKNKNTNLRKIKFRNIFNSKNPNKKNPNKKNQFKLFKEDESIIPKIETVFVPKLEKNIEVVSNLKENINVDYTYLVPKPIVIPVEVPILKFKDHFKIVPIKKKIIPVIKYSDDIIYVDCCVEKPYIILENVIVPVPFDIPIEENKYIHKAPPILDNDYSNKF
ncbi:inner membrane complex protein 1d, putative [Plasmodium gallinaceum]|uniref:Inner membrane complex protein 1d, putative n=1 Tax=Plasmodium gallinaceum TaxID=5849 RepID=A0A1J1H0S8_PLAGA|nr:inner membrane complex protein 1d, putative [Plasmodium gallinaceum]CRG98053.1 inner membrane complex protein 1d, putative [Plasmodium gallinaceum]